MNGFPDKASVEKLRYYGIRTVVLHTVLPKGLPAEQGWVIPEPPEPAASALKPIAGLGITRRRVGSLVIYEIGPGPKALQQLSRAARRGGRRRTARQLAAAPWPRRRRLALAAVLLVGLSYATMIQSFSWNQTSHYDLIRALNDDRTTIDPYQANTGDKVFYKGHYYSARAPGLALFSLPFYDALNLVRRRIVDGRARRAAGSSAATR